VGLCTVLRYFINHYSREGFLAVGIILAVMSAGGFIDAGLWGAPGLLGVGLLLIWGSCGGGSRTFD
jgi:hypothetical protein